MVAVGMRVTATASIADLPGRYQAMIGVARALSETTFLDCAYLYFATADPEIDGIYSEYESHNFTFGIRFKL